MNLDKNRATESFKGVVSLALMISLGLGGILVPSQEAEARLIFTTESEGVNSEQYHLDNDDSSALNVDLAFGSDLTAYLRYDKVAAKFFFNHALSLLGNELLDFKIENLATVSAPTCDGTSSGRMYFDTTTSKMLFCNGTAWTDSADLDEGSITTFHILNETILSEDIQNETILSEDILDGTIVTADIANETILSEDIQDGTIVTADIANETILSEDIQDATIVFADLATRNATAVLSPEYQNFTINADGTNNTGTLESDIDGTVTPNKNYYKWSTMNDTTAQDYDVVLQWAIPENFQGFAAAGNQIELDLKTNTTSSVDNKLDMTLFDTAGASVALTGGDALASAVADTWQTAGITFTGGTFTPGEYLTLKVKMSSLNSNPSFIGALKFLHTVK